MVIERPLETLPPDRARGFLAALDSSGGGGLDATDPNLHTLGFQQVAANWQDAGGPAAFEPVALFGYRALDERTGVAYAVSMLESSRGVDLKKTLFLAIAHKARVAKHDRLFVVTPRALRSVFANFGVVFPSELQTSLVVGSFDLAAAAAQAA